MNAAPLRAPFAPLPPAIAARTAALGLALLAAACSREKTSTGVPSAAAAEPSSAPMQASAHGPPSEGGTEHRTTGAVDASSEALGLADGQSPPADMRLVPGGAFTMGADAGGQDDEHPAHTVTLRDFYLDRTEVTNAKWDECVAAGACQPKSEEVRTRHPDFNGPDQPVTGVSWDDAAAYCAWRGRRLPREAEFERAVRGSDGRRFPWGNEPPTHDRAVFSSGRPDDVGRHPEGRGPYGQDDLAGNAWEWMQDEYDPYAYVRPSAPEGRPGSCPEILAAQDELRRNGRQGFTGSNPIPTECEHSIRGGAYNYDPDGLRSTNRVHHPGRFRIPMLGLRCAKDADVPETSRTGAASDKER